MEYIYVRTDKGPEKMTKAEYDKRFTNKKSYLEKRKQEYGSISEQFEFIVENGIDAFIKRQKDIKKKYPKEG